MIDVGATECIPCKMMAPIMKELEEEYAGIADIIFIDVWKNPAEGRKYGVQTIPTQISFDRSGKEVSGTSALWINSRSSRPSPAWGPSAQHREPAGSSKKEG